MRPHLLWAPIGLLLLVACGGGEAPVPPPPALALTPGSLQASFAAGLPQALTVSARVTTPISGTVNVMLVDKAGILVPGDLQIIQKGSMDFSAVMWTARGLTPGTYTGNLEIRLCRDLYGNDQVPGSPVLLPYSLQVSPASNPTPLPRLQGLPDWPTFQAGNGHTGYVPVTLDPAAFSQRWRWNTPVTFSDVSPVACAGGQVYVTTTKALEAQGNSLFALRESDGQVAWSHDFGKGNAVNPPTVADGKVYLATSGHEFTACWGFQAATGQRLFQTPFGAQWEHYQAPVVVGGRVFTEAGSYGGLQAFDSGTGASLWFIGLAQMDGWTPAADATRVYTYTGGTLKALDPATGAEAWSLHDDSFGGATHTPVLGPDGSAYVMQTRGMAGNYLARVGLDTPKVLWSVPCYLTGSPAVAGNVVFAQNSNPFRLEARSTTDGSLLWSWSPSEPGETNFAGDVVATDSHVFVSTNLRVWAINRTTHAAVWSYGWPGRLALSGSGVLYISTPYRNTTSGGLTAINLK